MKQTQADADWQNRILCSDENCIGVIGPDGLCKECGKSIGSESEGKGSADAADKTDDPVDDLMDAGEEEAEIMNLPPDDWDNRALCNDENCIGVIGLDGRCKECGLS